MTQVSVLRVGKKKNVETFLAYVEQKHKNCYSWKEGQTHKKLLSGFQNLLFPFQ